MEEFGEFSVRLINSDGMGEIDKDSAFDCEVRSKALELWAYAIVINEISLLRVL